MIELIAHLRRACALACTLTLAPACTETAVEHVATELRARGGPVDLTLPDGTRVTLSRAELAFGPFYVCAGAQAGQSCQTALAEWRDAAVVDVLRGESVTLGTLEGYSGRALSYMHDCGIVSTLTAEAPLVLPAAEELGGRSVALAGSATVPVDGAPSIPFRLALTVASSQATDRGQPAVRSSPGQFDAVLGAETSAVTASIDATEWLRSLPADAFWQDESCTEDGPAVLCAGSVSQDCQTGESLDCADFGEICAPDRGCQEVLILDENSPAGRAVGQAIALGVGLQIQVDE